MQYKLPSFSAVNFGHHLVASESVPTCSTYMILCIQGFNSGRPEDECHSCISMPAAMASIGAVGPRPLS